MLYCQSIKKSLDELTNEDSAVAKESVIAVSDGAGGGGIYADRWSKYLIDNIPDTPIATMDELNGWIEKIWKPFYDEYEAIAKQKGGMVLKKFYDEGSFATLAAIWPDGGKARWMTYGDSVAFCYNWQTHVLQYSTIMLTDFANPPYLINSTEELLPEGFKSGVFDIDEHCWLFVASDALSHFLLMAYMADESHREEYSLQLQQAIDAQTRNSQFVRTVLNRKEHSFEKILKSLVESTKKENLFRGKLERLRSKSELGLDDYSLAAITL